MEDTEIRVLIIHFRLNNLLNLLIKTAFLKTKIWPTNALRIKQTSVNKSIPCVFGVGWGGVLGSMACSSKEIKQIAFIVILLMFVVIH